MEMFRQLDADGSGTVTREEFLEGCKSVGFELSRVQAELVFSQLDADGSGRVNPDDLDAALKKKSANRVTQRMLHAHPNRRGWLGRSHSNTRVYVVNAPR